jgi:hypothetical protein
MWPDVVGPDDLKLLEGVLDKASCELSIESGSEEQEELASLLLALFQTVKEPDELLSVALRGARFGRARPDIS